MGLADYVNKDDMMAAAEKMARILLDDVIYKGAQAYAKESANPYDDAAVELVKSFLDGMVDGIHDESAAAAPAAE
jgi:hypothetical protein